MLEDRDYMRERPPNLRLSLTAVLLAANVVFFITQWWADSSYGRLRINGLFALSVPGLRQGYLWQLITFQFMHASLLHLLGNLLVIYFFGRPIEEALGKAGFLKVYLTSGVFGGLLQLGISLLWPRHVGAAPVVGASAGAFGLVAAFAALFPELPLTLLVFPVSMRAKFLLVFALAPALFGILVPLDNVAHAAHLGGIVMGFAIARWHSRSQGTWRRPGRVRRMPRPHVLAELMRSRGSRSSPERAALPEELPPAEFISKEVDPILDKISAHGIQSLTPRERRILEAASARIDRR
jgi:membrane associated rhomboid family serine protease